MVEGRRRRGAELEQAILRAAAGELAASGYDGMTMDKAGRLFVAHASLGHVLVFAPNGELIARIKSCAGASCTNVAIGGDNRDRLYITESATGSVLVADISGL